MLISVQMSVCECVCVSVNMSARLNFGWKEFYNRFNCHRKSTQQPFHKNDVLFHCIRRHSHYSLSSLFFVLSPHLSPRTIIKLFIYVLSIMIFIEFNANYANLYTFNRVHRDSTRNELDLADKQQLSHQ